MADTALHRFNKPEVFSALPDEFPYPFHSSVHAVAREAALQWQQTLLSEAMYPSEAESSVGKMIGVLVVRDQDGQPGFLAAFSGKWNGSNHYPGFVPPVFDTLDETGFYRRGEEEINQVNRRIEQLENSEGYKKLLAKEIEVVATLESELSRMQEAFKQAKEHRKKVRSGLAEFPEHERASLLEVLEKESIRHHYLWKDKKKQVQDQLAKIRQQRQEEEASIQQCKQLRRQMSAALQQQLFESYHFLNARGDKKHLLQIFGRDGADIPPSGAGECAAPKLLQYAYIHGLTPVALAEFWWGPSPASEIRKHGYFYPACRSKCLPILTHMLEGLKVGIDLMQENPAIGKELPVVYDDPHFVVVHKPAEMLSVPGKSITDSVYTRMRALYPEAEEPMVVHRLDMSTSGLMLLAKTKRAHQHLQSQFIKRKVKKSYIAVLEGTIEGQSGEISLPLRVDLDHRPRQVVCATYGKPALTRWEKLAEYEGLTRVRFYPITGRTHQLRVHAAHTQGLNSPIKGDDLYGQRGERLHLHAETMTFEHPVTGQEIFLEEPPGF
jgi:tRNA pseudouridine32 synthase/23S rRNA pseudouridine746 synthase